VTILDTLVVGNLSLAATLKARMMGTQTRYTDVRSPQSRRHAPSCTDAAVPTGFSAVALAGWPHRLAYAIRPESRRRGSVAANAANPGSAPQRVPMSAVVEVKSFGVPRRRVCPTAKSGILTSAAPGLPTPAPLLDAITTDGSDETDGTGGTGRKQKPDELDGERRTTYDGTAGVPTT
jgi:hypothetical protein